MMLVTHRGPYRFSKREDGGYNAVRGAGGVVSALLPLLDGGSRHPGREHWIAAAMDDDDIAAVRDGATDVPELDLRLLALDPETHRLHYDVVANSTLWFLHHGLFDTPRRPRFDHRWRDAWEGYVAVNREFATAVSEHALPGETVLVHDYQLALVPGMVRADRDDLRLAHFTHTPFCGPTSIRMLPTDVAELLCSSMAAAPAGFHTARWARAYRASVSEILGPDASPGAFDSALGPDPAALADVAASREATEAGAALEELVGDRKLILRSDRVDPSKNIVRGFLAFDRLLEVAPQWRGRVVFVAMLNRSRDSLAEYLAYQQEVELAAARVNERWSRSGWTPVVLDLRDDFARTVAGFARYDVLLVNPIKDGLNLVAKEGPLVNQRAGVLCLSPETGAFAELHDAAVTVHPFDIEQGAHALATALSMPHEERMTRHDRLRQVVRRRTPQVWLDELVTHAR